MIGADDYVGSAWLTLSFRGSQIVSLVIGAIVARFVAPSAFGLVALASVAIVVLTTAASSSRCWPRCCGQSSTLTTVALPASCSARRSSGSAVPLPKVAALLEEAVEDLLAFYSSPADHWTKLRSTNPLERVNREIGRRTDVVGIVPNDRSLIRLATSIVIEQTTSGSSVAATSRLTRSRRSSIKKRKPAKPERRRPNHRGMSRQPSRRVTPRPGT